jgi:hypothetical protein
MTTASIEAMTTTITGDQKTEYCCELQTILDFVNTLYRSIRFAELESEDGSAILNSDLALVEHISGALGDALEKFDEMTTTITDEQKTEYCCELQNIVDLINSLHRSAKLIELELGTGSLSSDSALIEHIGRALVGFLEKFDELPTNLNRDRN